MFLSAQSDLSVLEDYPRLLKSWYRYSGLCEKLGRLPSRKDIHPADIKFALGYEMLIETDRKHMNPKVRLIGTVTEEFTSLPHSATGKTYDAFLSDESRIKACNYLITTLDQGQPLFGIARYARTNGQTFSFARIIYPLSPLENEPEMTFAILEKFKENDNREVGAQKEESLKRWL